MADEGQVLGAGYVLEEQLGAGGMGVVWRARPAGGGDPVAVKVIRTDLASDDAMVERFLRERQALLRVQGPHVASLVDTVTHGGTLALVTEYVPGGDLHRLLRRRGPLPPPEVVRLGAQVLDGLASVHAAGILHRDVKPSNVLLRSDGDIVLTDFGVARLLDARTLTRSRAWVGTPHYLAPEVAAGEPVTVAADLYATGILLYELLAGTPPFDGEHLFAVLKAHAEKPPPSLPNCPEPLWQLLSSLLAKSPAARPTSASVLRDQLAALADRGGRPGSTLPTQIVASRAEPTALAAIGPAPVDAPAPVRPVAAIEPVPAPAAAAAPATVLPVAPIEPAPAVRPVAAGARCVAMKSRGWLLLRLAVCLAGVVLAFAISLGAYVRFVDRAQELAEVQGERWQDVELTNDENLRYSRDFYGVGLVGLGLVVVTIFQARNLVRPRALTIDGAGIDLGRRWWGRRAGAPTLPWERIRDAAVLGRHDSVRLSKPTLVVRLVVPEVVGQQIARMPYEYELDGYRLCVLRDLGADASKVEAALAAHRRPLAQN